MKERGILMCGEMVRPILEDRKLQTRRIVKPTLWPFCDESAKVNGKVCLEMLECDIVSPYGQVGDKLWVQESFLVAEGEPDKSVSVHYKADYQWRHGILVPQSHKDMPTGKPSKKWYSGRFMPRWASRITLEITNIRVERVQDISVEDAKKEGVTIPAVKDRVLLRVSGKYLPSDYWPEGTIQKGNNPEILKPNEVIKAHFASLWDSINAKRGFSWESNPYVWVIEFRKAEG